MGRGAGDDNASNLPLLSGCYQADWSLQISSRLFVFLKSLKGKSFKKRKEKKTLLTNNSTLQFVKRTFGESNEFFFCIYFCCYLSIFSLL